MVALPEHCGQLLRAIGLLLWGLRPLPCPGQQLAGVTGMRQGASLAGPACRLRASRGSPRQGTRARQQAASRHPATEPPSRVQMGRWAGPLSSVLQHRVGLTPADPVQQGLLADHGGQGWSRGLWPGYAEEACACRWWGREGQPRAVGSHWRCSGHGGTFPEGDPGARSDSACHPQGLVEPGRCVEGAAELGGGAWARVSAGCVRGGHQQRGHMGPTGEPKGGQTVWHIKGSVGVVTLSTAPVCQPVAQGLHCWVSLHRPASLPPQHPEASRAGTRPQCPQATLARPECEGCWAMGQPCPGEPVATWMWHGCGPGTQAAPHLVPHLQPADLSKRGVHTDRLHSPASCSCKMHPWCVDGPTVLSRTERGQGLGCPRDTGTHHPKSLRCEGPAPPGAPAGLAAGILLVPRGHLLPTRFLTGQLGSGSGPGLQPWLQNQFHIWCFLRGRAQSRASCGQRGERVSRACAPRRPPSRGDSAAAGRTGSGQQRQRL